MFTGEQNCHNIVHCFISSDNYCLHCFVHCLDGSIHCLVFFIYCIVFAVDCFSMFYIVAKLCGIVYS
jgi:hypothetical protein